MVGAVHQRTRAAPRSSGRPLALPSLGGPVLRSGTCGAVGMKVVWYNGSVPREGGVWDRGTWRFSLFGAPPKGREGRGEEEACLMVVGSAGRGEALSAWYAPRGQKDTRSDKTRGRNHRLP